MVILYMSGMYCIVSRLMSLCKISSLEDVRKRVYSRSIFWGHQELFFYISIDWTNVARYGTIEKQFVKDNEYVTMEKCIVSPKHVPFEKFGSVKHLLLMQQDTYFTVWVFL